MLQQAQFCACEATALNKPPLASLDANTTGEATTRIDLDAPAWDAAWFARCPQTNATLPPLTLPDNRRTTCP